jgi:misacylated tRNA(Ala) deacylase
MEPEPLTRMHSAEHLLNSTMVMKFECERSFSAHINKKKSKCDYHFERALEDVEIKEIEDQINRIISEDLPVVVQLVSRQTAADQFNLKRLPESVGDEIRIITMGDYDAVPCIGDHVNSTGQIGHFAITTSSFENGILRIRFKLK